MAICTITNTTITPGGAVLRVRIDQLTYPYTSYSNFQFDLYGCVSRNGGAYSSWVSQGTKYKSDIVAAGGTISGYYWAEVEFSYLYASGYDPNDSWAYKNYAYVVNAWAYYGQWYGPYQSGSVIPTIPTATVSSIVTQKTTIGFDYTNPGLGGYLLLNFYQFGSWVDQANSGFTDKTITNITNGYHIALGNLVPATAYTIRVLTLVKNHYSWAGNYTPTTTAWPTIPSGVVVSSYFDGGMNVTCGSHGYEPYSFGYFFRANGGSQYWKTSASYSGWQFGTYGTQYSLDVTTGYYGRNANGTADYYYNSSGYTSANSYWTKPSGATITVNNIYSTFINVSASGMQGNYYGVEYRVYQGANLITTITTPYMNTDITGLSPSTTYTIRCYGYAGTQYGGGYSVNYSSATITTLALPALGVPSLSSSWVDSCSITFTVATVANATSYIADLYKNGVFQTGKPVSPGVQSSFTGLIYNSAYTVRITVVASGYTSNAKDFAFNTSNLTTPGLPTNISFTQSVVGGTQVSASWTMGTNATRTDIDMSSDGVTWGSIDWPLQANSSYTLETGYLGQHYFRLRSCNYDGTNAVYGAWTIAYGVVFVSGNVYVHNGSTWVLGEVYNAISGSWVKSPDKVKVWNGSAWV